MRILMKYSEVVEDKCTGCEFCELVCEQKAIQVHDKKAKVDKDKCYNCAKCIVICPNMAIRSRPWPEPKVIKLDDSDVDPAAIKELCKRADLDPERVICICTLTKAKETAVAILKGARTMEDLSAMTGVKSDCGGWCMDPLGRLLEAYGIDVQFPENAKGGYPMKTRLRDVSDEVAKKYPEFRIEEDKKLLEKRELPFLPEML